MYHLSIKQRIVQLFVEKQFSIRRLAELFGVSKSSVQRWCNGHSFEQSKYTPRTKFSMNTESFLTNNPFSDLRSMAMKVETSKSTLWRVLKKAGYSKKRTYPMLSNKSDLEDKRKAFCETVKDILPSQVMAIDETSFYTRLCPKKAWSLANHRVKVPVQRVVSKRHTLVSAMSTQGIVSQLLFVGSCNQEIFRQFIQQIPRQDDPKYLLMDNVAFHKTKSVLAELEKKNLIPLFTSPYSPDWNPVEMYFSILKQNFRKQFQISESNFGDMSARIQQISDNIGSSTYSKIFQHVWTSIKNCFHK